MYNIIINSEVHYMYLYMKTVKEWILTGLISEQIFFSIIKILYLCKMMGSHWTYCDDHCMMYVS